MASTSEAALLGHLEPRDSLGAWELAKARFLDGLDDTEKAMFTEATAENVFYQASNVQRDDSRDSKSRAILQTMQPLISAVDDYGKAMDTFANISSLYLAPIWGSVRVILVIASSHGRFYNRMVDTFGRIGDILPRFREYQRIFDSDKHQRFTQALSAAYLDIISLCTEFKTLLRNLKKSAVKRIFQPLSPALNAQLEDAVLRFRQHRKTVDKEAELCHMIEEKEARELVVRNQAAAEARERQNRQEVLLSLLSKIDHEHKHRRMRRIRHKGTGSWFTASDEFKTWLTCPSPSTLCLYGIPGCGKSVLISSLIDELLAEDNPNTRRNTIFYYCDHADKRTLDPINIFSNLALQVLRTLGDLPSGLLIVLERICQENSKPDLEDVVHLLIQAVERVTSVVILLDGLDEVNENDRKLVFHHLQDIVALATPPMIKVLVASREDTSYLTLVPGVTLLKRRLGTDAVTDDIDCFLKHTIHDLIRRKELVISDPILEEEIFEALSKGSKGMFLWVKFQLDDLCRAETDSSIRQVLQNLPRDLGETYDRLLARIDIPEQRKYIQRMFAWIICAKRPLEVDELREAIAFTIEDDHFDPAKIPNDLKRLARACGNLIVIDDEDNNVQIAHYTVEQYLVTGHEFRPSTFCFTREQANFEAGKVCVAYLSFSDFELQITQYEHTTTSNFAILKDVVNTKSMLPPNSQAAKLVKKLKQFRGNRSTSTTIPLEHYIRGPQWKSPTILLSTKYRLLSYVAENWLHHTSTTGEGGEGTKWSRRYIRLFEIVAFERSFSFDVRPWDLAPFQQHECPFVLQIGWAISENHVHLLRTVTTHTVSRNCFEQATKAFTEFHSTRSAEGERSLRKFSQRSCDTWPKPQNWESWLYRCILEASDQSFANVLHFCFPNWVQLESDKWQDRTDWDRAQSRIVGYLILDAASSSHTSVVEVLTTIVMTWPKAIQRELWTTTIEPIHAARALETAFLTESEHLMELLSLVGCKVSASFKESLVCSPYLQEALNSNDAVKIKLFLRIFGATTSSLWDIESRLWRFGFSFKEDVDIMLRYVVTSTASSNKMTPPIRSHWIWAIEGASYQDHIDVLLTAGGTTPWEYISWLLWEAIVENRYGRLNMLLKAGEPIAIEHHHRIRLTREQVQAMRKLRPTFSTVLDDEKFHYISPLSCAVLCGRLEMMESFLGAGALINGSDSSFGLAPIHFAAITDSLVSFKCLERHGANLEVRDFRGRDIGDLLLSRHPETRSEDSLFDFLNTHRNSYPQYSRMDWGIHSN